ncbi:hypothetical protein ILYODFUR_036724 [Ilyodon furcidens]|uniref:Uncharacterized protein n=1 Tax=Ilyodon furcidens TaxID=33524 RepID=A0ABV0UM10_9TELE
MAAGAHTKDIAQNAKGHRGMGAQVVFGLTTCTAPVQRRASLSASQTALECLTANIQKMLGWCAPRNAFQASSSSETKPSVQR